MRHSGISTLAIIGGLVIAVALFASESHAVSWMFKLWTTNPDNSHGLLVPFFSVVLLWIRREMVPTYSERGSTVAFVLGVGLILMGTVTNCVGIYCRTPTLEAGAILPCVAGVVLCCGGWAAAKWAWPSVLFLVFMVPLPRAIGLQLGSSLQSIATFSSTYLLQTLGMPAVADGNVIFLTVASLGVAEACSGIRMLVSFFALTTAMCFVVDRPAWEKCLLWFTAPIIAVVANVLRITATGIAYEYGSEKLAEMIFHDLAGWLMMPIGLLFLWVEMFLLLRVFEPVDEADLSASLLSSKA